MDTTGIRYFGSERVHGPDGVLTPDHGLMVYQDGTQSDDIRTVADMVAASNDLIVPVSFDVLPF